ncbi:hypothetical protein ACFB49_18290 [Sphingomonas sp. DBB INV C78]|uniref:hypothetical protein n=1 Tax=Sphingomonas sp. DBB INV C78 TaxID=3349434 RepID=UPI0036D43408
MNPDRLAKDAPMMHRLCSGLVFLTALAPLPALAQTISEVPAEGLFRIVTVAETTVQQLPPGPLYWRVETFPTLTGAKEGAGATSLAATVSGKNWLFTLGPKGGKSVGGKLITEIGPVPEVEARQYLLRINHAGGPPGAKTPVHSHPGSEAFYVMSGKLCQKTSHGTNQLEAGRSMNGHEPGMVMQLTSCGTAELDQLVMFVVDATKPFSPPASFD